VGQKQENRGCNSDNEVPNQENGAQKSRMCMHNGWYRESGGQKWEYVGQKQENEGCNSDNVGGKNRRMEDRSPECVCTLDGTGRVEERSGNMWDRRRRTEDVTVIM
jgi:hypothetical protein